MATLRYKNFDDIFIRFDTTHERDRRTDGQTDKHRITTQAARAQHRAAKMAAF